MANIFTNDFGVFAADNLEKAIKSNTMFFAFAAKSTPYSNDAIVPKPGTSYGEEVYKLHDEMLFAKMITSGDIARVVRNNVWATDTVYTPFTDKMPIDKNNKYFVSTQEGNIRSVFVCVDNNGGKKSLNAPLRSQLSPTDTLYKMNDGYIWKFMFSVGVNDFQKFGSSRYIPIVPDSAVSNSAVHGAVESIQVQKVGLGYNTAANGQFKQVGVGGNIRKHYIKGDALAANTDFYNGSAIYITENAGHGQMRVIQQYGEENGNKFVIIDSPFKYNPTASSSFEITPSVKVVGDGSGLRARAVVGANTTSVERVDIVERGSGYTFATATVEGNSGVLDSNGASKYPSTAVLDVIVPPVGGLGKNPKHDLSANKLCFSADYIGSELPVTKFRKIGIMVNPILDHISVRLANTANFTKNLEVKTSDGLTATVVDANLNEQTLVLSGINGPIKANTTLSAVSDAVNANSTITKVETDYTKIDTRLKLDLAASVQFEVGEKVTQENTPVYGYVNESANSTLYLTEVMGTFDLNNNIVGEQSGVATSITKVYPRHIRDNTGQIIYVENMLPVTRSANTTERLKMVMEF